MSFIRFDGTSNQRMRRPSVTRRAPWPEHMEIGQIVSRNGVNRATKNALKCAMRKQMKRGMEFSVEEIDRTFSIRRDK